MRLAYSCHDSFPSSTTNTQQVFWTLLEVARLGVAVTLYVPSVHAQAGDGVAAIAAHYGVASADVPSTFAVAPAGALGLRGRAQVGWFDWRAGSRLTRGAHDLAWTRDPLALASCLRAGWPTVFETYRPDFATRRRFAVWRRQCLGHPGLRGVIVHSRLAADAFLGAGVPGDRCLVAHNGFAPSLMDPVRTRADARTNLGIHGTRPLVVYAGHADRKKGTETIVRMASLVPNADFLLVGVDPRSDEGARLDAVARACGAENVVLRPRVPVADVATYLYAADCLIIPPSDEPLRRFRRTVLPMKVFSYLAAGRPILAPRLPDIEEVLTDGETARLVAPDDLPGASAALRDLLADAALQERLGRQARAAAAAWTWSARADRIVQFLAIPGC